MNDTTQSGLSEIKKSIYTKKQLSVRVKKIGHDTKWAKRDRKKIIKKAIGWMSEKDWTRHKVG